jgi:hypothetical protein
MRDPKDESDCSDFSWHEDGLIPLAISSFKKRMPWNDRFAVNTVVTFCLEMCGHRDHKEKILEKLEGGSSITYDGISMPEIYAKIFDLIKDTTRYFYF